MALVGSRDVVSSGLRTIEHEPLWVKVCDELRFRILSGDLAAGTHLVENDVGTALGVSRGPVRQALAQLEHEGFVETAPRQGSFVTAITPGLVREKYALRHLLEEFAAREVGGKLSEECCAALLSICDAMREALARRDARGWYETQMQYHRGIIEAANMPTLTRMWDVLGAGIGSFMIVDINYQIAVKSESDVDVPSVVQVADAHCRLVEELRRGDGESAARAVEAHLDQGERAVLKALRTGYPMLRAGGLNEGQ